MSKNLVGDNSQPSLRDQAIEVLAAMGITAIDGDGRSDPPLIEAVKTGNQLLLKMLLRAGCKVNAVEVNPEKCPALNLAIIRGRKDLVKILLEAGADTEVKDLVGTTPLMAAVFFGMNEAVQDLLQSGANTSVKSNTGETALIVAARNNRAKEAKTILQKSCESINLSTNNQSTALMFAASKGNIEMVKLLLQFSCDVDLKDVIKKTASAIAEELGHQNIVNLIADYKRRTAPISATEQLHDVMSSLQTSANSDSKITNTAPQKGEVKTMLRLIKQLGEGANVVTATGWTPLHFATKFGDLADVETLITQGADVNKMANSSDGKVKISVLNCAVGSGNVGVVKCVLSQGNLGFAAISDGLKTAIKFNKFVAEIFKDSKIISGFAQLEAREKSDFCADLHKVNSKKILEIKKEINNFAAAEMSARKKSASKKTTQQRVEMMSQNTSVISSEADDPIEESLPRVNLEIEVDQGSNRSSFSSDVTNSSTSSTPHSSPAVKDEVKKPVFQFSATAREFVPSFLADEIPQEQDDHTAYLGDSLDFDEMAADIERERRSDPSALTKTSQALQLAANNNLSKSK